MCFQVNTITDLTKYILTPFTWLVERLTPFFAFLAPPFKRGELTSYF